MSINTLPPLTPFAKRSSKEKFFQYFPLAFSVYYFIPAFIIPITGWHLVLVCFYFLLFVTLYVFAIEQPHKLWPALAMILLGTIASKATPGAHNFLIFASFFIGFTQPTRYMLPLLAVVIGLTFILERLYHYEFIFYSLFVLIGSPTLGLWGVIMRLHLLTEMRERKSREEIAQLAKTVERERIARDLHDVIGHTLSTITLKAELAHKLLSREQTDKSQRELEQLLTIAREGLKQVRETISGVKRATLADTVMQLADSLRQRGMRVEIEGQAPTFTAEAEQALGLVLTELTTNILRHSKASECYLRFAQHSGSVEIQVCDNGQVKDLRQGNGLEGVDYRITALGGSVHIDTRQQFCVSLSLPGSTLAGC